MLEEIDKALSRSSMDEIRKFVQEGMEKNDLYFDAEQDDYAPLSEDYLKENEEEK